MGRVREEEEGKTEAVAQRVRKRIEEVKVESRRRKIEESKYNVHYEKIEEKKEQKNKRKARIFKAWLQGLDAATKLGESNIGERRRIDGVEYAKRKKRQ